MRKERKGGNEGAGAMDSEFTIQMPTSEFGYQGLKCPPFPAVVFFPSFFTLIYFFVSGNFLWMLVFVKQANKSTD